VNDEVLLYDKNNKPYQLKVVKVRDAHTFTVGDWTGTSESIFVYGKKVNDFRTIDFDQITAMAVGAIQELTKQQRSDRELIQQLKAENEKLKDAGAEQSEINKTMKAQIDAINERLNITTGN
jgi:protein-tyrosine-phosphatase